MERLTEAKAVLAPKRRVSSDTLTTDSFILEPPIVVGIFGQLEIPLLRRRSPTPFAEHLRLDNPGPHKG